MESAKVINKITNNQEIHCASEGAGTSEVISLDICRLANAIEEQEIITQNVESTSLEDDDETFRIMVAALIESSSDSDESDEDVYDILLAHSDREDDNLIEALLQKKERKSRNSIKNLEKVVPIYTEEEFRTHFRISKGLYINLSAKYEDSEIFKSLRADKRLPGNTSLAVFLWFAGHEACSYRDLSDRFNLPMSSVCRIVHRVTMFLSSLSLEVIRWPNEEKKRQSALFFGSKCSFSKAIGCIDGTHIVIDPPAERKDDYIDRKGNITLMMQAICDENKKFINIFVGFPGSSHDSWVFQNSPIYEKLPSYCRDYYLLGDSAYPCYQHLITLYKDNGHLTVAQKNFNLKLSSGRVAIEHAFGILKQRFRQLYYCKLRGTKKLCHFIRACCLLHNIANENDLPFSQDFVYEDGIDIEESGTSTGNAVRDSICRELSVNRRST